jgi:heme/copper-type cytochrome/quinol oxidase subunit 3
MTQTFDRGVFARRLVQAGTAPESAEIFAALLEDCLVNELATRSHVMSLETRICDLRKEVADDRDAILAALRTECALLLPSKAFHMAIVKLNYRAYLESLQFMVVTGILGILFVVLLAILWRTV